jgi:hypothetical protein
MFGTAAVMPPPQVSDGSDEVGSLGQEEDEIFRFVNEWLCAIADYSMGLLVVELLKVERFSPEGRDQLRVDLEYLRCRSSPPPSLPPSSLLGQQCDQCSGYQAAPSLPPLALSSSTRSSATPHSS